MDQAWSIPPVPVLHSSPSKKITVFPRSQPVVIVSLGADLQGDLCVGPFFIGSSVFNLALQDARRCKSRQQPMEKKTFQVNCMKCFGPMPQQR